MSIRTIALASGLAIAAIDPSAASAAANPASGSGSWSGRLLAATTRVPMSGSSGRFPRSASRSDSPC